MKKGKGKLSLNFLNKVGDFYKAPKGTKKKVSDEEIKTIALAWSLEEEKRKDERADLIPERKTEKPSWSTIPESKKKDDDDSSKNQ